MMKNEMALAQAMKKAGVDTDAALLHAVAADCLRKAGLSPRRALAKFVSEVCDAGGIMAALHPRKDTEKVGIAYLQRVAADMRGDNLKSSPQGDGEGRRGNASAGHRIFALPDNSDPAKAGVGGQSRSVREGQGCFAPDEVSTVSGGEANPEVPVRATARMPSPGSPRGSAALKAIAKVTTIFDTHKLRDGTPLGDLRFSQLDRFIASNAQEAAILRMVRDAGIPADPSARIREIVSVETMQRIIQKAAEEIDHAA